MSLDFETVRMLRYLFAIGGAAMGGALGWDFYGNLGLAGGLGIGALVGWNTVDLFKGRAQK
jgi:hypothetical protein